jgi:hypothetical protein
LAGALGKRGIRLLVYLPSGAPNGDGAAQTALEWQNGAFRNREFQLKWGAPRFSTDQVTGFSRKVADAGRRNHLGHAVRD